MGKQAGMAAAAPRAMGPYSHYNIANGFVFVSGMGPIEPATGELKLGSIADETRLTMENLGHILRAAGTDYDQVVRCTVFLKDLGDFQAMNQVYGEFFPANPPTRTTVGADLLVGIKVEIDCIAALPQE